MKRLFLDKSGKTKIAIVVSLFLIFISLIFISSAFSFEKSYVVGDELRVDLKGKGDYSVKITTPSRVLLREGQDDIFTFLLDEEGDYSLKIIYGAESETYFFSVGPKIEEPIQEDFLVGEESKEQVTDYGSFEEVDKQDLIKVGEPVKWEEKVFADSSGEANLKIPSYGENVVVTSNGFDQEFVEKEDLFGGVKKILSLEVEKEILVEGVSGEIEIEYETPAPLKQEQSLGENEKKVIVSSIDEVHYENVLAFTEVEEKYLLDEKSFIEIFWAEEGINLDFEAYDLDGDSFIDYIEWIVPHLSTQTFHIIYISDAIHLNQEREAITNVYEEVAEVDSLGVLVDDGEYIRVEFEQELNSTNDITIYASSSDFGRVEVYEKDSNVLIADFGLIGNYGEHKIYLDNLKKPQDTFDLKVVGGSVYFDHIIDPSVVGSCISIVNCTDNGASGTCTCAEVDDSNNVYAGGGLSTKSGNLAEVIINLTNSSMIPSGALISDSDLYVELAVQSGMSSCTIEYQIGSGSWTTLDSDCTDETTETTLSFDLSSLTEAQLESLTVKINAVKISGRGSPIDLNVDYVYLNVSYAVISGDYNVNLTSPDNNYESNLFSNFFNYVPLTSGSFLNCSLWDNSTGTFSLNQTNSSLITNGSTNSFSKNFTSDGAYSWNVQCCDNVNGCFFAPLNRTIFVDTLAPTVSAVYPENDSSSSSLYGVDFVYNVTDSRVVDSCSLLVDGSSVLSDNSITKSENQTLSYPIPDGVHIWSVSCTDVAGNIGYSENRTINVTFSPQTYDVRWYETSTSNYTSTADIYLANSRDSVPNEVAYTMATKTLYPLSESVSPFMVNNGALIGSGTVSFSGYFTASSNNKVYITWKVYVTNSSGDFLICQAGDDSTTGTRLTGATGTYSTSCNNPSDIYLSDTDRIKLVVNAWNDANGNVDVSHVWDDLFLSYVEFNTFSSLGDLSVDLTYPTTDLSITTNDDFNATCFVNCSAGDCLDTDVYLQYNTSATGWINIGSSGNLILAGGETNPHNLGTIDTSAGSTNFTISGNLASVNNIRCVAESTYSNANGSTTRQVDVSGVNQPPYVTLFYPGQNDWMNSSSFNFSYYVDDVDDDLAFCDLYIDGVYNQTNSTLIVEGGYNNFTISGLTQGQHNWSVNCTDVISQSNSSSVWNFYVDTTFPQIDLVYPGIDETVASNDVNFNFTVSDNLDDPLVCNLTVDGNVENESFSANNGTYLNTTIFDLSVGEHLWNVSCIDEAGNLNTSETRNFSISDSNPVVYLVYPGDTNWVNTTDPVLIYNATDNNDLAVCDLYLDGVYNQSNSTILINGAENNFTVAGLTQGIHNWTVNCTDDAGLFGISENWDFYVDSIFPQINLNLPEDYFNSSEGDTNFNFTVSDNLDDPLTCNLTIDSIVVDPSFNANNASLTNRLINNVDDGLHYWNVSCIDEAGNLNTSETWRLNVTEYPSISLQTEDNFAFNYTPIDLDYLPNDNSEIQSCDLYLNGVFNQTNSTPISKGSTNTFSVPATPGYYNWSVQCTDDFGLVNISENRTFSVDLAAPNVTSYSPQDGAVIYSSVVDFNFTVTDDLETNLSCSLIVDGNVSNSSYFSNGSVGNFSATFSSGGVKFWNISCIDGAGNIGYSETRNFTLYTPPVVNLLSPGNLSWTKNNSITFVYNISDGNDDLTNSTFILDGVENQTNSTLLLNQGNNNFTVEGISEGIHNWTVWVYDKEGLLGTQTAIEFTVDRTNPVVTINFPKQGNISDDNNVTLNFSIADNLDTDFLCNISVDDFNEYEDDIFYSGENIEYLLRGDGNYSWYVQCSDSAGNNHTTSSVNFSVIAPPKVTLNFPTPDYYTNSSTITFNYTPEDAIGITSCTLYVDGIQNETDTGIERYDPNYFTYPWISEGEHNWTVECLDSDANTYSPPVENFTRDITPPTIILSSPGNGTPIDFNDGDILFTWRQIDSFDEFFECDLYVDDNLEADDKFVQNDTVSSELVSGLGAGEHVWNVTCWDGVGNLNSSDNWTFNITYPDFYVDSNEIYLNTTSPVENQSLNVTATIKNIGYANSTNVLIQFYLGHPLSGGTQIGNNQTTNLGVGQEINLSQIYFPGIGSNEVYVIIDQYGDISELDEGNNIGNKNFTVGSWQYFYGDLLSYTNYSLEDSQNESVIDWSLNDFNGGSIFVTDLDSSVSWSDVFALGKDSLGGDGSSDFAEADSLLSMTGLDDSISSLYIGEEDNFSVFGGAVNFVPITNSTNNTNFVTGIMWDFSDDGGDNEYDSGDAEDLIFVTKIKNNLQGAYGVYDYEMRVPAYLRDYAGGTSNTVAFYMEIN